jgi:hypothetical protein
MLVTFRRDPAGRTAIVIRRADGVVVGLPTYDRAGRVPHDLAHLAAERALGLSAGLFGSIAGGGMFDGMSVVEGRPRHDAADRSRRLLDGNKATLGLAELMADVVARAVRDDAARRAPAEARRIWATFHTGPYPWDDRQVAGAVDDLAALTGEFRRAGTVQVTWPDRLTSPVPGRPGVKRGRRGRVSPTDGGEKRPHGGVVGEPPGRAGGGQA